VVEDASKLRVIRQPDVSIQRHHPRRGAARLRRRDRALALSAADIAGLAPKVAVGTPVRIVP